MQWKSGETWEHKKQRLSSWHTWFAWYPVNVAIRGDGHYTKAWLERVQRKGQYRCFVHPYWWDFEYRTINNTQE